MPLIKTLTKGAAALLFAALMVSAPALAAPGSTQQSLVKKDAKLGASLVDSVLSSIGLSFAGFESDRVFSRQARRDDDRGDRGSRRGRSGERSDRGGDRRSDERERRDESGERSRASREPPPDRRGAGRRAGERGEDESRMADRRGGERGSDSDHRSDRGDRGDHRSDRHDGAGDRYADRRDHYDRRGSDRRYRSDDRPYGSGRGGHYAGYSYGGGHQSYGFSHGHGPHHGHGYYCNTHFAFHYVSGYDPVGWYIAFHDGYDPPYGCRTVERIDYRRGRRIVYGAVQCYDDWGYPYIVRGSQYAYRTY